MADGYCGVAVQKEFRDRKSDDLAAADNYGAFSLDLHIGFLQHSDYALRCTWNSARLFHPKRCHIERVETVDVLILGNGCDNLILTDVVRQRQLNQDTIHGIISIQLIDKPEKLRLRDISRLQDSGILYSDHLGSLGLTFYIRLACRVFADQNNHKMRYTSIFFRESLHLFGHFGL